MSPHKESEKARQARLAADRAKKGCKPWHPGGPGRPPKNRGKAMEPACRLPNGVLRAEHVYDAAGTCGCGAKRMEFAPRPELRAVMPAPSKAVAKSIARLNGKPAGVTKPAAPERVMPPAAPAARPKSNGRPAHVTVAITQPKTEIVLSKRVGGTTFAAVISDLEHHREATDKAIEALREVDRSWPA